MDKSQSPLNKLNKSESRVKGQGKSAKKSANKKSNLSKSVSPSPKKHMKSSANKENEIYPQEMVAVKNFGRFSIDMEAVILNENNDTKQSENR